MLLRKQYLVVFILFISMWNVFANNKNKDAQNLTGMKYGHIKKIKIDYVGYDIMTSSHVKCTDFDVCFDNKSRSLISDSINIKMFIDEIIRIEKANIKSKISADVRIKVQIILKNRKQIRLCIGYNVIDIEGNSYVIDESFRNMIRKMVYNK
jgi:hypothetical protein